MFLVFAILSLSTYEENGWGKKLKKAVKKVTKPVTKATKKIVKETGRFVEKTKTSETTKPIQISALDKKTDQSNYATSDPVSLASQIAAKHKIDPAQLRTQLSSAKYARTTKKIFNRFEMDILSDKRWRTAKYIAGLVATTSNPDGTVSIKVNEAVSTCKVFAEIIHKKTKKRLGGASSSSKSSSVWRPLISSELSKVFSTVETNIKSEIQKMKV